MVTSDPKYWVARQYIVELMASDFKQAPGQLTTKLGL